LVEIGLLNDEAASQAAFPELRTIGYIRDDDLPLETEDGRRDSRRHRVGRRR
jgi:hypothetical protein